MQSDPRFMEIFQVISGINFNDMPRGGPPGGHEDHSHEPQESP